MQTDFICSILGISNFHAIIVGVEITDSTHVLNEVVVTGSNVAVGRNLLPYTVSTVSGKQLEATGNTQLLGAVSGIVPFSFPFLLIILTMREL